MTANKVKRNKIRNVSTANVITDGSKGHQWMLKLWAQIVGEQDAHTFLK